MKLELDEKDLAAFDKSERDVLKTVADRISSDKPFDHIRDSSSFNNYANLPMNARTGEIYRGEAATKLKEAMDKQYSNPQADRDNLHAMWVSDADIKKIEEKIGYSAGDPKSLKTLSVMVEHDGKRETLHNISTLDLPEKYYPHSTRNNSVKIDPKMQELIDAYKTQNGLKYDVFEAKYRGVAYFKDLNSLASNPPENFKSSQHHAFETIKAMDFSAKNSLQSDLSAAFTTKRLGINQNQVQERLALSVRNNLERLGPIAENKETLKASFLETAKNAFESTKNHLKIYNEYQLQIKNAAKNKIENGFEKFEANAQQTRQALESSEQMKAEAAYAKVSHEPAVNLKIANETNAAIAKEFGSPKPVKPSNASSVTSQPAPVTSASSSQSLAQNYKAASFTRQGSSNKSYVIAKVHYVGLFPTDKNGDAVIPPRMSEKLSNDECLAFNSENLNARDKNYQSRIDFVNELVDKYNKQEISWKDLNGKFNDNEYKMESEKPKAEAIPSVAKPAPSPTTPSNDNSPKPAVPGSDNKPKLTPSM